MNFNTTKSVVVETTKTASTAIMNESIDVAKILELQTKLIGSINVRDLENVFKLPTKN